MSNLESKIHNEDVQLTENRSNCWYDPKKNKYIPFDKMSNSDVRRARSLSQLKEIDYYRKAGFWGKMADKLEEEGNKRGLVMKDLKTKYHKNKRHHKQLMSGEIPDKSGVYLTQKK